jgi:hypothetical protein
VEWMIGKVYWMCGLLKEADMQCMLRDDLGSRFIVAIVLSNCHTCLYGSQASMYFNCESPDLEDYTESMFSPVIELGV